MSGEGRVVCVTGASGYIASWLVKLLLEHDYTVKGTVRDPNDPKKTEHLQGLDGAGERLQLFKANLVEEGSFDAVVDGCDGVFHTASPVFFSTDDPRAQIDSAVKGTLNVLKACAKFPSVKRVVITSSMASVIYNGKPLTPDVEVDETWKSDADFCNSMKNYYATSKTLAEEAAWKFAEENGINVVTLHPGIVVGPLLQPIVNLSTEVVLKHITGDLSFPLDKYRFVDVRDVATAHIQAFELPSASGRYCLVARVMDSSEVLKIVLDHYPALRNRQTYPEGPFPPTYKVSTVRAKTLGIDFTPVEITLIDAIESFKEKGFLDI